MRQPHALVVGTGYAGQRHVEALREIGVSVVGPLSAREVAQDPVALRDERVGAVHVCGWNDLHPVLVRAALAAEKHVICEKPLALDARTAEELADLAERSRCFAILGYNYRFHPMMVEFAARARAIGGVHDVRGGFLQDWLLRATDDNWRVDPARGGVSRVVADIGAHWLDLAEVVTRRAAKAVVAHVGRLHGRATEDHASMLVRFADGLFGSCVLSQASAGRRNALELSLDGTDGALTWRFERPDELWIGERGTAHLVSREQLTSEHARRLAELPRGPNEARRNLLSAVYARMGGDNTETAAPLPSFRDGARHLRFAEAALESARTSRWVEL